MPATPAWMRPHPPAPQSLLLLPRPREIYGSAGEQPTAPQELQFPPPRTPPGCEPGRWPRGQGRRVLAMPFVPAPCGCARREPGVPGRGGARGGRRGTVPPVRVGCVAGAVCRASARVRGRLGAVTLQRCLRGEGDSESVPLSVCWGWGGDRPQRSMRLHLSLSRGVTGRGKHKSMALFLFAG